MNLWTWIKSERAHPLAGGERSVQSPIWIKRRLAGRVPLLVDAGIRRGTDVLMAIALGARAVLIGRPYIFGLAAGGAAGVSRVVEILRDEFKMAMALTGRRTLAEIDRSVIG